MIVVIKYYKHVKLIVNINDNLIEIDNTKIFYDSIFNLIVNNQQSPLYNFKEDKLLTVAKPSLPPLNDFLPLLVRNLQSVHK